MTALNKLSLTELEALRARDELDTAALLEDCLAHIDQREEAVRAFQYIDYDRARAELSRTEHSCLGSGLEGIPFGVKDVMDTHDMPTGWGSPIYNGRQPIRDAGCVATLRACGAVALGKTVTTEFACFSPGVTRNPLNLAHTPGGSSQGSAAAVADCMVPFALGTQTAASVTRPAAYCGIVGYKSSQGAFDLGGVCSLSQSMDALGFMVRDARDLVIIRWALLRGSNPKPSTRLLDVGLVRTPHWGEAAVAVRENVERVASVLSLAGVNITEIQVGPADGALTEAHKVIMAFEVARSRIFEYRYHRDQLSAAMCTLIEDGLRIGERQYREAGDLAREWKEHLDRILCQTDCLLAASAPGEAPVGLQHTGDPLFSRMWNLLGAPSVALPVGVGPLGLPLGIQLIGRHGADDTLIAHAIEVQAILSG